MTEGDLDRLAYRHAAWNVETELGGGLAAIVATLPFKYSQVEIDGFAMKIVYVDLLAFPEADKELDARPVDRNTLFRQADFISINLPLQPDTRHYVHADLINLMKSTAFLINMARGPIWREADVVAALQEQRIAGAGSDVYEVEPITADNPLLKLDNFVGTPHMSAHTEEAMIRMSMVAKDVLAVLEGREPQYPA